MRSGPDLQLGFAEPRLRWVLLAFHLAAALGLDEHAVFSLLARRPFAARLLTPGSPVTPRAGSVGRCSASTAGGLVSRWLF